MLVIVHNVPLPVLVSHQGRPAVFVLSEYHVRYVRDDQFRAAHRWVYGPVQNERLVPRIALENRARFHIVNGKILLVGIVPIDGVESEPDNLSRVEKNAEFLHSRIAIVRNAGERLNSDLRSRGHAWPGMGQGQQQANRQISHDQCLGQFANSDQMNSSGPNVPLGANLFAAADQEAAAMA
jgi:hypothetical protein